MVREGGGVASEYAEPFTNTRIQDQYSHVGLDRAADLLHLFEELAFLFMSPGGVYDNYLEFLLLEFSDTLSGDSYGIGFCV